MGQLRIGYISHQFPPEVGAGAARVAEMAELWSEKGAHVKVFTGMPNRPQGRIHPGYRFRLWKNESRGQVAVYRSWLYASPVSSTVRTLANNLSFMVTAGMRAMAHGGSLDVLIASSPPFFIHPAGTATKRLRGVPLILELRDLWPDYLIDMGVLDEGLAARLLFHWERHLLARADEIVVVTESFRKRVIEKGVPAERIHVIPNGVDPEQYYPAAAPAPRVEGGDGGQLKVGYLGNFGAGQDLRRIVDAAAILHSLHAPVKILLTGDGAEGAAVRDHADSLRLPNLSIRPAIPKTETRDFYNTCDLCLVPLAPVPIFSETVPSKIFEIMACGRPILASVAGEAAAIVKRSGCGLVAKPGDAVAIAQQILAFVAMGREARELQGARGVEFVHRHYRRDRLAAQYLDLVRSCAGHRAQR